MNNPPPNLQGILWFSDIHDLDIERKNYIIHQILSLGVLWGA
ncbi:MAG: hypothetical protein UT63_C0009G0016 [Candidatus Gottesmanbacteria bacterium GW2011_GWC2_39_8]|uniref:Uncharacterized protein n=1 Tax=Candidatus Gottesmanbacteria bacterium GW2011_GWC2_39_8 TaxID=1618450 RepID=A0A0G0Q9H8_9BACT|nr:MAG: hypothetical protein UT63_C0009G0016 [Candidatus Gottesmanbacteria bacterium GW2011_GWC2_39_8]